MESPLITPAELAAELASDAPPVLLDVRWRLGEPAGAGRERYVAGHLPGARFLDLETVLTRHTGDPADGRHPLPDAATLSAGLGALGVGAESRVVVYDEPGSFAAERAWWVLRWAGLDARVLDGGVTAWTTTDGDASLATGDEQTWPETTLELITGHLPTLDTDEAGAWPGRGLLLDARAPERYRGEVEPMDPRAGHVPGARNLSAASLYTGAGTMPPPEMLRAALADAAGLEQEAGLGDDVPVAVYCGSGVSATRALLALAVLGRPVEDLALYGGSWSAWSSDPTRPVATGPEPG